MTEITVQVEFGAIPDGWELDRIGLAKVGETIVWYDQNGKSLLHTLKNNDWLTRAMIIRKIYDPGIRLRSGWLVWKDRGRWLATKEIGNYDDAVCGLEFLPGFIPPPDGQPRQIT